ncbi:MAG TPA: STAS domain-containing protein [Gammaproteobacteria bacterium]|nr:STAS domain-containing protein [Gammaproteobacteria bacterium]
MARSEIADIIKTNESDLLADWIARQQTAKRSATGSIAQSQLQTESGEFLRLFVAALDRADSQDIGVPEWEATRAFLENLSRSRAAQGFTPTETATFVFSLKKPLFHRIASSIGDPARLGRELGAASDLLDQLGLHTAETFQRSREQIIRRQQQELLELSTPVVQLWDGVLAVPLIGTLDSARTQVVMEALLDEVVRTAASIVVVDITGVPTVDTIVAQHLLKTVAAARLMGTDCIISGIRPQIAQTIVHLGVNLGDVTTKATLADAFRYALHRRGLAVERADGAARA